MSYNSEAVCNSKYTVNRKQTDRVNYRVDFQWLSKKKKKKINK